MTVPTNYPPIGDRLSRAAWSRLFWWRFRLFQRHRHDRRDLHDFERVLNAYYPTVTDQRLTRVARLVLRATSAWRYHLRWYRHPLELRLLQRLLPSSAPRRAVSEDSADEDCARHAGIQRLRTGHLHSGAARSVRRLSLSCEVHVFALRFPFERARYTLAGGHIHALGHGNRGGLSRLMVAATATRAIAHEHRSRRFDVIHALWADEPGLIAVRAGQRLGVPVVVSLMGGELVRLPDIAYGAQRSRFARYAINRAFAGAHWCTAGSQQAMAQLRAHRSDLDERSSVVPLGVDVTKFCPDGPAASGGPSILHVGSLSPIKDQHTLLRAFGLVNAIRPDLELRLIGDGPLRMPLERAVDDLKLTSHVRFLGEKPHDELPCWYRAATICALSSRHESQSVVALEAAACGIVTVGTAVGVLAELAPASRTVAVGDHRALAAAMQELLDDDDLRGRLAAHARSLAERSVHD